MPPVVQGRRAPGPADAARFGVDWVRLGLGLASISVLLSQDCPRLRGIFPLRNGRSGRSALGCRFGLPFPRRLPGFPLRVPAWAGCRFGRIRGRPVRWDGPIQPQYHCTPARRRGQALFVRPPPLFSRTRRRKGIARRGPAGKNAAERRRRAGGKPCPCRSSIKRRPLPQRAFPTLFSAAGIPRAKRLPSPRLPFATPPERPVRWLSQRRRRLYGTRLHAPLNPIDPVGLYKSRRANSPICFIMEGVAKRHSLCRLFFLFSLRW